MQIRELIFSAQAFRNETCTVISGHYGDIPVEINLKNFRKMIACTALKLKNLGFRSGDTLMLTSFSCNNELSNAVVFGAAVCMGIRVFIPMFPEPEELTEWQELTGFKGIIMPASAIFNLKDHNPEKHICKQLRDFSREKQLVFADTEIDLNISDIIHQVLHNEYFCFFDFSGYELNPETEAVVFTTSGSSGKSKLMVYTHERLLNSCQSWQHQGLFDADKFGNAGFTPLFTHTIGIRSFLNSLWTGHPFCMITTDWFIRKPEQVRYLLMQMQLAHLVAGPAFYNNLLELFRLFPELKNSLRQSLKAAIMIGAPYDIQTAGRFRSATGVLPMNAFGTTETLMVLLNENPDSGSDPVSLGQPLPGVGIGLTATDNHFTLSIKSEFQANRTLGQNSVDEYFQTGDLVDLNEKYLTISFVSRVKDDFIKDEYGVKIPLHSLKDYYSDLFKLVSHIEFSPLIHHPGLSALLICADKKREKELKNLAALVRIRNEELKNLLGPFEYMHRHIERIAVVYDALPLTRKGTISESIIQKHYAELLAELRNPFVYSQLIENTDAGQQSCLSKYSDPELAELMEALRLDKSYFRGEGDYLYYKEQDREIRVTDFAGGFGAGLFGHNHPAIRETLLQFLESGMTPLNDQGSEYHYPSLLARELNGMFGRATGQYFRVLYGNSGAEALEIALQHAYYAWRQQISKIRKEQFHLYGSEEEADVAAIWEKNQQLIENATPAIITVDGCFHGYTSAARSLLNLNKKQRMNFSGMLRPVPLHVSDTAPERINQVYRFIQENVIHIKVLKTENGRISVVDYPVSLIIAAIAEPVRGEGGITEIDSTLMDYLASQKFPLISDEIQCGMGRTGTFPAYGGASYYLMGKSLGGGFEKISAVMINDEIFEPSFTQYYNSTFAHGEMAACCALKSLQILQEENLVMKSAVKGSELINKVRAIAGLYPDIISSVQGKGLMIGIHFNPEMGKESNMLRLLMEHEKAGYLFAGWLLHAHQIRVLPSLSKPNTLRLEPSAYLKESDMDALCVALTELCELCKKKEMYAICKFLMNDDPYPDKHFPDFDGYLPQSIEPFKAGTIRVGFVGNFTFPHRELQIFEPDFRNASDTGMRILFNRLQVLLEGKPMKIFAKNILNNSVYFTFYLVPYDTAQLEIVNRYGKKQQYITSVQEAVDAIAAEGSVCMSLGAHTSIITGNGLNLAEKNNCRILTGNTVTVASVIYHLKQHLKKLKIQQDSLPVIAIVGASGNIGSGIVECAGELDHQGKYILLGNNLMRLKRLKKHFHNHPNEVMISTDMFDLKKADIVICCVNTNDPVVFTHHLSKEKPVFMLDISVPKAVSEEVKQMNNISFCSEASFVSLKDIPEVLFSSHTPKGKIFCCAGESILYGLYHPEIPMKGHINKDAVFEMLRLGELQGFFKYE
jgi:acetylornithine/succinyldiaminopimelate/putrescine aminotransferase/predicted amino acid dehydrogenase/acyl-coenzyme A synthetase/AMP-(fatty) acid ligase